MAASTGRPSASAAARVASRARRARLMRAIWRRNHGSMPVCSATASTPAPRRRADSTSKRRSGVATGTRSSSSATATASVRDSPGSAFSPARPTSSERTAFCSDSQKVRPMAITSPTDCMRVPRCGSTPGSFSKAQRGILVTT